MTKTRAVTDYHAVILLAYYSRAMKVRFVRTGMGDPTPPSNYTQKKERKAHGNMSYDNGEVTERHSDLSAALLPSLVILTTRHTYNSGPLQHEISDIDASTFE